ncbi:S8 family serine peptidase [Actinomadura roseirufa]|uniref:S8 family serine peptidase n=1 Tax=Actinomadura roseirufa TaxID=2094049 RepID=UPI001040E243|nr:S8 family serine peptidase [Actinomadura roseirufa]
MISAAALLSAMPQAAASPSPRSDQWWFKAWSVQEKVWPLSKGAGVTVGVIDTGVNAKLPELSGVVLPGLDTTGAGNRGQVDFDEAGHGTSMSTLIAGQGGGTTGFAGIAPEAKLLPIRLQTEKGNGDWITEIVQGIRFAVDHGAKVVNMSVGQQSLLCPQELLSAIRYAIDHDVVLVASAGNDGQGSNLPELPARCPGVLAVGAVTKASRAWVKTQKQNYVTVSAPGAEMGVVGKDGTYYPNGAGTSGSSALTAGAVALVRARNPSMSGRTVVQRLIATAMPVGGRKWSPQTGFGVILVRGAMDPVGHPVPGNAPNPVYEAFDKWKASTYRAPSVSASPASAKPKAARDSGGGSTLTVVALVVSGVLIAGGLATGLLVLARGRRPARPF